jgi:hypothetical protein
MILATAGVVVFAALLASAVFHSMLVSGQARLDDIGVQTRLEQSRLQREQLRLADFQSPERIAREAKKMGMVPAAKQSWVSPGGDAPLVVDTERTTATSTTTPSGTSTSDTSSAGTSTSDTSSAGTGSAGTTGTGAGTAGTGSTETGTSQP